MYEKEESHPVRKLWDSVLKGDPDFKWNLKVKERYRKNVEDMSDLLMTDCDICRAQ